MMPVGITVRFFGKWAYEKDRELYKYITVYDRRFLGIFYSKKKQEGGFVYLQRKTEGRRKWLGYFWKIMHYTKFTIPYSTNNRISPKQYTSHFYFTATDKHYSCSFFRTLHIMVCGPVSVMAQCKLDVIHCFHLLLSINKHIVGAKFWFQE